LLRLPHAIGNDLPQKLHDGISEEIFLASVNGVATGVTRDPLLPETERKRTLTIELGLLKCLRHVPALELI